MEVTLKLGALEAEALVAHLMTTCTADPHLSAAISSVRKQMGALEAKREKQRSTSKLWDRLMERSGGKCECGCGGSFDSSLEGKPTMDHWHGRAKAPENEKTCWLIRWGCHDQKTRWRPSRTWWTAQWVKHRARVSGGTA